MRSVTSPLMKYLPSGDTRNGIDCLVPFASTSSVPLFHPGTSEGPMPVALRVMPGVTLLVKNSSIRLETSAGLAETTVRAGAGGGVLDVELQDAITSVAPMIASISRVRPPIICPFSWRPPSERRSSGTS